MYDNSGEHITENYTFRLKSAQDLLDSIESFTREKHIEAGWVALPVSQSGLQIAKFPPSYEGHFEIVSLAGTVSVHGSHLHFSASDGDGKKIGGHLVSGCKIYTTAEIVIMVFTDVAYKREFSQDSGYDELVVYDK